MGFLVLWPVEGEVKSLEESRWFVGARIEPPRPLLLEPLLCNFGSFYGSLDCSSF